MERRDREERRVPTIPHLYLSSAFLVLFVFLGIMVWALLIPLAGKAGQVPLPEQTAPDLSAYPWLYLRHDEPLAANEKAVQLIAVGDVMLGRGVADKPRPEPCPEPSRRVVGGSQPLAAVAPWLRAPDGSTELEVLTLGNLECVIAEEGVPRPGPYRLRAPPSAVADLRDAGFDVLGLANNHALDFGPAGLAETVSRLQEAGMATVGVGPDAEAAVVLYGPTLLNENQDVANRFMTAYLKAVRQYNEGKTPRNIELLAEFSNIDPEFLERMCWPALRTSGELNVQAVLDFQDWALEAGHLDNAISAEQFYDGSFVTYANLALDSAQ